VPSVLLESGTEILAYTSLKKGSRVMTSCYVAPLPVLETINLFSLNLV
jgi:hypothetical protein